ncbi:MAG: hypothetical protein M1820_008207 [Bogoriella megaspora]|nr:MAG: hypothetical protein M1820_008207 [Bogoriella megaspora]
MSVIRKGEKSPSVLTDQQQSESNNGSMEERRTTPNPASPKIPHGHPQPGQGEVDKHHFRYEPRHNYNYLPDDLDAESDISPEDEEGPILNDNPLLWIRARLRESDERFRVAELIQERENPEELESNDELPTMNFSQFSKMEWLQQINELYRDSVIDRNGNHYRLTEVQQNASSLDDTNKGQNSNDTANEYLNLVQQHCSSQRVCEENLGSVEANTPRVVASSGTSASSNESSGNDNMDVSKDNGEGSRDSGGNGHNQARSEDDVPDRGVETDKGAYQAASEGPVPSRKRSRSLTSDPAVEEA